jgi:hypothetical protein
MSEWPKIQITLNTFRFSFFFSSLTPPYHMVVVFFMPSKKILYFYKNVMKHLLTAEKQESRRGFFKMFSNFRARRRIF